jgi:hypothetical protein
LEIINLPIDKKVLSDLRKLNHERVYCYKDNELLFIKDSGMNPDKIDFTIQEKKSIRHDVNCIIHNHCNNSSLSLNDFLLAVLNNVKTVVAVSQDYIWRLDFILPFKDCKEVLNFTSETYDDLKLSVGRPLCSHIAWSIVSGKYDSIKYSVVPLEGI